MEALNFTIARKNLAKTMKKVCDDHAPVVITREKAGPVVLISLEDYHSLEETSYLMRSPKNASRLIQAIEEIETHKAKERQLLV